MKPLQASLRIGAVVALILLASVGFLFLTRAGLIIQAKLAERLGCPSYWFFIIQRLPDNPNAMYFSAERFEKLAYEDLFTARQMADRAIQLNPADAAYYYQRGHINMTAQRYAEAKSDFENALRYWKPDFGRLPTEELLTNALIEATGCLEVHMRAWGKTGK